MMLLVNHSPTSLELYRHPNLGVLCCPRSVYADNITTWRWAADNDAYSNWDAGRYRAMLERLKDRTGCLFVTAPDVVGDAKTTGHLYALWRDELADCGQPVALVAQDGLQHPPWDELDALFIGGTDRFKMSDTARHLVHQAGERGKWVHMGRVNGHRRLMYAKAIGCHSVDGTSFSWFRDTLLRQFLNHAAEPPQMMFEHHGGLAAGATSEKEPPVETRPVAKGEARHAVAPAANPPELVAAHGVKASAMQPGTGEDRDKPGVVT